MRRCQRCDWSIDEGDKAEQKTAHEQHAADADHPICGVCQWRSLPVTHRQTCPECVGRVRADLADIENLYSRLPGVLVHTRFPATSGAERTAGGSDEAPLLGGTALVALSPGGAGSDVSSRAGNRDHAADELPSDPQATITVLSVVEDDWRQLQGHPAAGPPTVSTSVAYLMSQLDRMAQAHSEFDWTARDLHRHKRLLEQVTSMSDDPESGAPCVECDGALLERKYGTETHVCPRCHREYDTASYWLAVASALQSEAARRDSA